MKKFIAILMAALMTFALVACSASATPEPEPTPEPKTVVGTWTVKDVKVGTQTLTADEIAGYGLDAKVVLSADGTGVVTLPTSNPDFSATLTYTETMVTYMKTEIPYTFDGDTISVDFPMNGMTFSIVLVRA